jgi:hypothetical protein
MREVHPWVTDRRGRRHWLVSILLLVRCAVVAGATTWAAITEWVLAAPQQVLPGCEIRFDRRRGLYRAPHPATIAGLLARPDPGELDLAYARHRAYQPAGALPITAAQPCTGWGRSIRSWNWQPSSPTAAA